MKIFILEDEKFYGNLLHYHLSLNPEDEVLLFQSGKAMLDALHQKPDVITLDYTLPDMTGQEVLKEIRQQHPKLPVVVISGQEDVSTAISLLKEGVYDYIIKDDDTKDKVWNTIKNIRELLSLEDELDYLKEEVAHKYEFEKVIKGNSPGLKRIFSLLEKACTNNITVSILGETGTGKEVVAKAIHYHSERKKNSFVAVNVAAIPRELIESELFGHEKWAFTGAHNRRIGKFEEANKGTLFLDEIGEMDMAMQAKLLRVLQEKELTRVGGNEQVKLDVRIIVATHRNLQEEINKGNFREDLYYRLLGLPIELPPLRDRGHDVLVLAKYFLDEFCKENKMKKLSLSPAAQDKLMQYNYPGNVRELKAIVELSAVLVNEDVIEAEHINFHSSHRSANWLNEETTLENYNRKIIRHFLDRYDNNVLLVAEKLDLGKSTIYRMLKNKEI